MIDDAVATRALAEDRNVFRIAAERGDVFAGPDHGQTLVFDPVVTGCAPGGASLQIVAAQETKDP